MRNRLKSVLKTYNNEEKGVILPLVLIGLLMTGLMIPPLLSLISTSLLAGNVYESKAKELYAADAGVMDATCLLQNTEDTRDLFGEDGTYTYTLPEVINGKTVTVEIVMDLELFKLANYMITSTATDSNGSTATIEAQVQDPTPPIWMAVGALDGDLDITTDVGTETEWVDIYANGDIYMRGGSQVYANAYYTYGHDILAYPSSGEFHGIGIETPELQLNPLYIPNEPVDTHIGDMTINQSRDLGPVYIQGNLTISGQAKVELKGTVWVTGRIIIEAGSAVYGTDDNGDLYFIISEYSGFYDAICISGNTTSEYDYKIEAMLYAPNGHVYVSGTASVNGSAVGKSLEVLGASNFCSPIPFQDPDSDYLRWDYNYWKIS